jgi:uncharacterized protein YhaN
MRIRNLNIEAFGHLVEREFPDLPPDVVILLGPNEAGKSTLFKLLSTLLYGFYPASRDDFPYDPWHVKSNPEFRADLALDDGRSASIHRRLMSAPRAMFVCEDAPEELGNGDLPFVGHVGRELYEAVYALRQENLRSLDDARREEIEDRLLGGLTAEVLRPTRDAVAELEAEADALWRADRRGKPLYRELEKARATARKERSAATEADEAVRSAATELDATERRIEELAEEKVQLAAVLRRAEKLAPIRAQLRQIAEWRAHAGDVEAVERLPDQLAAEHQRLRSDLDAARGALDRLGADREALVEQQAVFTDEDRSILVHADAIERWSRRIEAHERERVRLAELVRAQEAAEAKVRQAASAIFREAWADEHLGATDSVVLPDLRAAVADFEERDKETKRLTAELPLTPEVRLTAELPGWVAFGAAGLGLVLLVIGLVASSGVLVGVGAALLVAGVLALGFNFHQRRQRQVAEGRTAADLEQRERRRKVAEAACDEARRAVAAALAALPIAEALLRTPDLELYQNAKVLQDAGAELQRVRGERANAEARWAEQQADLARLLRELGCESATPDALAHVERRRNAAVKHRDDCQRMRQRVAQIDAELAEHERRIAEADAELRQFIGRVRAAVGVEHAEDGAAEEWVRQAEHRQRLAQRAREDREKLESEHPDLAELEREIAELEGAGSDAWSFDDVELERRRDRREALEDELRILHGRRAGLQTTIEASRAHVSVGEWDGRIAELEEQMDDVARRCDRLTLLAALLREADRRFREQNQPDVLQRASEYLRTITGGRYRALTTMPDASGEDRLAVATAEGEYYGVEPPLSTGTLDQIFLAFRLAVVDHLDDGRETLPLVLDEALINWDDQRLERSAEILGQVAKRRQVFLFTCHPWLADRLATRTGSKPLELPGPAVAAPGDR